MKALPRFLFLLAPLVLAGCAMGPDYHRDKADQTAVPDLPGDWRWKKAEPNDAALRGDWWTLFGDPGLDALETKALAANTDLRGAVDRVSDARARARLHGAEFVPNLTVDPSYSRNQLPASVPIFSKIPPLQPGLRTEPYNSFSVPLDLSYEVDLWGRVRRSFEAARAEAQASAADAENVRLLVAADVAAIYFALRELDSEEAILAATVKTRQDGLDVIGTRVTAGRATQLDADQAKTDYTNALAEMAAVQKDRAQTQDALAVLCGIMPTDFVLPPHPLAGEPPVIPADLPGSLLERRPDVAAAEREMAARNAGIGVAQAAFFPQVTLTGQGGYLGASASDLFTWQNSVWSYGPSIRFPLFDGGRNLAGLQQAKADYDSAVASYRGSVLHAVQDVEDALSAIRFLAAQRDGLEQSAASASSAARLARRRFEAGQVDYIEVTVTEDARLVAERARVRVQNQQFHAAILLVKAMGGGWDGKKLSEPL